MKLWIEKYKVIIIVVFIIIILGIVGGITLNYVVSNSNLEEKNSTNNNIQNSDDDATDKTNDSIIDNETNDIDNTIDANDEDVVKNISLENSLFCANNDYENCIAFYNNQILIGNFKNILEGNTYFIAKKESRKIYAYQIQDNKIISDIDILYNLETKSIIYNNKEYMEKDFINIKEYLETQNLLTNNNGELNNYCHGSKEHYSCIIFNFDNSFYLINVDNGKRSIPYSKGFDGNHGLYHLDLAENVIMTYNKFTNMYFNYHFKISNKQIILDNYINCDNISSCEF